ncbi:GNAT family N-acetyltransferase [Psychrobacillus sp. MER TA 171]|uniref:GNAT family N-acetyltransferase n=1 Tax=Psychrobacillus sp. MER TA 171 TaxID=2939577 RepID=UPI00203E544D|nr:GNAT family N-acetyltransferase [Psychrobacillus sp. MER TA 171]MCM3357328.1 GNAT family N-acetyltransferase [Psychrobacillus sp. MER TA 171]
MQIIIASPTEIHKVNSFFTEHLNPNSSELYSAEFLCPLGIQAAIRRNQMVIAVVDGEIVGAMRFYPKKTNNTISLYQFAISKEHRGKGILKKMLLFIKAAPILALCPVASEFNHYFLKTDWQLQKKRGEYNEWIFK